MDLKAPAPCYRCHNIHHNDSLRGGLTAALSTTTLCRSLTAECRYKECHYAKCHYAVSCRLNCGTQHKDTLHNIMLSGTVSLLWWVSCQYVQCCCDECRYAKMQVCQMLLYWLSLCHVSLCHYGECRYTECRGAMQHARWIMNRNFVRLTKWRGAKHKEDVPSIIFLSYPVNVLKGASNNFLRFFSQIMTNWTSEKNEFWSFLSKKKNFLVTSKKSIRTNHQHFGLHQRFIFGLDRQFLIKKAFWVSIHKMGYDNLKN
jgi:hypothetical protein